MKNIKPNEISYLEDQKTADPLPPRSVAHSPQYDKVSRRLHVSLLAIFVCLTIGLAIWYFIGF